MCCIGIVASIFNDARLGLSRSDMRGGQTECRARSIWQKNIYRIGKVTGKQGFIRGTRCGCRASACRPAAAKRGLLRGFFHCMKPYRANALLQSGVIG